MDSEGPVSVLDHRVRSSSLDRVIMDRLTRQRASGRHKRRSGRRAQSYAGSVGDENEQEEVVIYRIPQPYRTSLSAVNSVTWGKPCQSQSFSLDTSLRSDLSCISVPRRRSKSPKHVTYNPKVTVRLSDTEDSVFTDLSSFELDDEEVPFRTVTSRFSRRLISPKYNEFSDPSLFPTCPRNSLFDSGLKFKDVTNLSSSFSADAQSSMSQDSGLEYSAQLRDISEQITSMQWSAAQIRSPPLSPPLSPHIPQNSWQKQASLSTSPQDILKDSRNPVINGRCDNISSSDPFSKGVEPADSFCPMSDVNKAAQSSGLESSWPEQTQQVGSLVVGAKLQENDSSDGCASVQNSGDADGTDRNSVSGTTISDNQCEQTSAGFDRCNGSGTIIRDYQHDQTVSFSKALRGDYGTDIQKVAMEAQLEEQQQNFPDNISIDNSYVYLSTAHGHPTESDHAAPPKRSISLSFSKFLKRVSPHFKYKRSKDRDSKSSLQQGPTTQKQDHTLNNGYYNPNPVDAGGGDKVKQGSQFSRSRVGQSLKKLVKKSSSGSKKKKKKKVPELSPGHYTIEVRDPEVHTSYLDLRDTVNEATSGLNEGNVKADEQSALNKQDSGAKQDVFDSDQEWPHNKGTEPEVTSISDQSRPDATSSPTMFSHHERMEFFTDSNISAILRPLSEYSNSRTSHFKDNGIYDPGGFSPPKEVSPCSQDVVPIQKECSVQTSVMKRVSGNESIEDCSSDIGLADSEPSLLNGISQSEISKHAATPNSLISSSEETNISESDKKSSYNNKENSRPRDTGSSKSRSGPPSPVDPSHKPSYLKLSCAVSGYGKYSYYNTYRDVAQRSLSSGQLSMRSYLRSGDQSMPGGQMPRSVSSLEHIKGPKVTGWKSSQDVSNRHTDSPVIAVNGHFSDNAIGNVKKNGEYFLQCMHFEETRLKDLCLQAEADMRSHDLPEEASGRLRAAIGKANLLLSQKFVQFMELCHNHMKPNPEERETKWEDLQGFWDIVKIQIDNVDDMFAEIELMKQNGWQEVTRMPSRRSSTSSGPQSGSISQSSTPAATPSHTPGSRRKVLAAAASKDTPESSPERTQKARQAAKARDEARKKMLLEKRAAMKQATTASSGKEPTVEIYVPEQGEK